jgi:DNA-binding transcriptional regulator LsrR (DeoR family)
MTVKKEWTKYLAVRAAWMSFSGGKTQTEIAASLGISQAKVNRLLSYAMQTGIVRIEITERPVQCLQLESDLMERFGLNLCIVVPTEAQQSTDDLASIKSVAAVGAQYLTTLLGSKKVGQVGIGMGRTIKATIDAMSHLSRPDLSIVSITGSLTRKLSANPFDVVQKLQAQIGGEGYFLPVPYLANSIKEKELFRSQESVIELLNRARNSDLFVIGIGSLGDDSHLITNQVITRGERDELVSLGAVGDLLGRFLDRNGNLMETELGNMAVGLHFEEIRGAQVLGLVGGASKLEATSSALSSGVITDLVIDEQLASEVIAANQVRID